MKRLGVYVFICIAFISALSAFSPSKVLAQSVDRVIENGAIPSQGTYDYFFSQGSAVFADTLTALNTLKTTYTNLADSPTKTQKLDAIQKNIQAVINIQSIYTADFNNSKSTGTTPAATQISALNKATAAFSTEFSGIPRIAEQQAILTGSNGSGGALRILNQLVTQANQVNSGTVEANSPDAGSLGNSTPVRVTGDSVSSAVAAADAAKCSIWKASLVGCVDVLFTWIIKNTFLQIAGFLVWLTANMLNFAIQVSILGFSQWAPSNLYPLYVVVRQIVSLVVVFAGLYLGFMYIIGREDTFARYAGWLCIYAIFVNFSYPVTRALTDVSNIVSLNVYSAAVGTAPLETDFASAATTLGADTAGALIMNRLGLAGLVGSATAVAADQSSMVNKINSTPGALITLAFVLYAAYIFFMATAIIATRTAVLVFLIVASPLLLIDSVVPKLGEAAMKLRKMLFEQLTVAPVFMVMLALTLKFMEVFQSAGALSSANAGTLTGGGDSIKTFFSVLMMLIMLHIMLKVTKSLAGEAGNYATNLMGKVGGFGLGVASGGAGLLARGTIGAAASRMQNSAWMDKLQGSRTGRGLYGLTNSLAQSTFDTRNIGMVSRGMASAGMGMGAGSAQTYEKKFAAREAAVTTKYESIKDDKARAAYFDSTKNGARSTMGRLLVGGTSDGDLIARQLDVKELELKKKEAASIESFTTGDQDHRKEMLLKAKAENNKVLEAKLTGAQTYFEAQGVDAKSSALVALADSKAALSIIEKDPLTELQKTNLDEIKKLEQAAAIEKKGSDEQKKILQDVEIKRKENREMVDTFRKNLKDEYFKKNYTAPLDVELPDNGPGPEVTVNGRAQRTQSAGETDPRYVNSNVPAYQRNGGGNPFDAGTQSFADNMRRRNGGAPAGPTPAPAPARTATA
jgi:hypothetical protein